VEGQYAMTLPVSAMTWRLQRPAGGSRVFRSYNAPMTASTAPIPRGSLNPRVPERWVPRARPASRQMGRAAALLCLGLAPIACKKPSPEAPPPPAPREVSTPPGDSPRMGDEELRAKTLSLAREMGLLVLRRQGSVSPFGLTLDPAGDNPRTFFPRDQRPQASSDELLDATVAHLARGRASADVGALAVITTLESEGGQSSLGIQVETRASAVFLVYPYSRSAQDWSLGEPQPAQGLFVGPLLHTARQ